MNEYTDLYKTIFLYVINHKELKYENKVEYIHMCCDCIEFISNMLNKKTKKNIIECIYLFIKAFKDRNIDAKQFFLLLYEFIKQLNIKKQINTNMVQSKLLDDNIINDSTINDSTINENIEKNTLNKIIDFIFNE